MADAARLDASNRMYNRLFWLDWISRLWVIGGILWAIILVFQTIGNALPGAIVTLTLPMNQDYDGYTGSSVVGGAAYLAKGTSVHFTQATMTVSHLPLVTVVLLGLGSILATLTSVGIAWCIFILVRRLRANEPFAASTATALTAAGLILGIGSTVSTILTAVGQTTADVVYLSKAGNPMYSGGGTTDVIEFLPLFVAGVLFALSGAFRYGARLQRETEGLV